MRLSGTVNSGGGEVVVCVESYPFVGLAVASQRVLLGKAVVMETIVGKYW